MTSIDIDVNRIQPKPRWLERLPGVGRASAQAWYPNIYVPRSIYHAVQVGQLDAFTTGLIIHEQTHLARIKQAGRVRWYVQYALRRSFRLDEELLAHAVQYRYLKQQNSTAIDLERQARVLSGWLYLWPASYDYTYKQLIDLWQQS